MIIRSKKYNTTKFKRKVKRLFFSKITSDTTFYHMVKSCNFEFSKRMYVLEIKILKIVKIMSRPRIIK